MNWNLSDILIHLPRDLLDQLWYEFDENTLLTQVYVFDVHI